MKKLIALILALAMVFALVACAVETPAADDTDKNTDTENNNNEDEVKDPFEGKAWYEDGELTILGIGNSFTDDTLANAYKAAKTMGIEKVNICYAIIGGCNLQKHLANFRMSREAYELYEFNNTASCNYTTGNTIQDVLTKYEWDFISFQQQSIEAGQPSSMAVLNTYVDKVREIVGEGPEFVWNMTWAYQSDYTGENFSTYGYNQMRMYKAIVDTTQEKIVGNERFDYLVPNGTALQNVRTSYIGDTVTRDTYHLNHNEGRYVATLTFLCTVLEVDPDAIAFHMDGVDEKDELACKEAIKNAFAKPFEVTESSYK